MKKIERAVLVKEIPQQWTPSAVIKTQFPGDAGHQREEQVPIFIRFLARRERIWKTCKRNWDWRVPPARQDDLALTH